MNALAAEEGIRQSAGISYACVGDQVTVQGKTAAGAVRKEAAPMAGKAAAAAPRNYSQASPATDYPAEPDIDCLDSPPSDHPSPQEFIENDWQSGVAWCMYWGQNNDPVNGTWYDVAEGELYANLYTNTHVSQILFDYNYDEDTQTTSLTGTMSLDRERFAFPPSSVDGTTWASDAWRTVNDISVSTPFKDGTVWSIQIEALHITIVSKAFDIDIQEPKIPTPRFLCTNDLDGYKQCGYPDGQEAGL